MRRDFLTFTGRASVEEVLKAYLDREASYWWLLIVETAEKTTVCPFGSLLPYRTDHIVHNIGDCAICSGIDALLWQDTGPLVAEALADQNTGHLLLSELPMAEIPTTAVTLTYEDGKLIGMDYPQMKGDIDGIPNY